MNTKEKSNDISDVSLDDIINSIPEEIPVTDKINDENTADEEVVQDTSSNAVDDILKEYSEDEYFDENHDDGSDDDDNELDLDDDIYEDEEYRRTQIEKRRKRKRRQNRTGRFIFGIIFTLLVVGIAILLAVTVIKYSKEFLGLDKNDINVIIEIPYGVSTSEIADLLYNEGVITDTNLFLIFSKIKGTDGLYSSGAHEFVPKMSYGDIVDELTKTIEVARETVTVTFPEGIRLYDAAAKLEEKGVCNAEEFIKVFNISEFGFDFEEHVIINPMKFYRLEGYFFPDTYEFYLEEDPRIVTKKIYRNFDAKITPDIYGRMSDLGMELEEVLTLASIVQAEAAYKSDMKMVASVFYNRLNNADEYPLLQSDPTTKYVNEIIKPNIEISAPTMFKAYDTYQGAGLTPGPICNPGLEAINAVLYPAESDYLYFCSNIDTGEFFYAKTLSEHEENLVTAGLR